MVREIDIVVIEDLVRAFGRALEKCPSITGVRLGGDGFQPIIIVDSEGDEAEEVRLKFPERLPYIMSLPE